MLETKYGLQYSMPHSVVHIVDNSMYTGELPTVVTDDPSLFATIVVSGAPMGADNEMIPINRSDVLNIAYGMSSLTSEDVKKYGQSVTYPSSIIAQDAPIKFMRVTPEDSTYAFSCLLIQWKWIGNKLHVRFNTTTGNGNNGLPMGIVHSSFKNVARLNSTLVKYNATSVDGWTQRVFMTAIAAGRGSMYNNFNIAINPTTQGRRPANARYIFSTIDTRIDQTVERFYASLINQNNGMRPDAIDSVNVQVGKRVKGSSIIVPTINEDAIKELYNEYMVKMKEFIDSNQADGASPMEWISNVYKTININTFDPVYGRYIYNGDVDVKLPYFQVDMFDLDIPQLEKSNRLEVTLESGVTPEAYTNNPVVLNDELKKNLYGIDTDSVKYDYHVGDVFLSNKASLSLSLITTINQSTGSITSIPISQVYTDTEHENKVRFKAYVEIKSSDTAEKTDTIAAVNKAIEQGTIVPTKTDDGYQNDMIIVCLESTDNNGITTFGIANVAYTESADDTGAVTVDTDNTTLYKTAAELYGMFAYPESSVTSFATSTDKTKPTGEYYDTPGATYIDTTAGKVYINGFKGGSDDRIEVVSPAPFRVSAFSTSVSVSKNIVGTSYDVLITPYGGTAVTKIQRYVISGTQGSIYRYAKDPSDIPQDYYSSDYGINPNSEMGGIPLENGYAGFFDDKNIKPIEFKWRYSELLVKAYNGSIDPRINSNVRCPAKYLFDGGHNTIVGQTILSYLKYDPRDIINASTIFTEDEKEALLLDPKELGNITGDNIDIDVKQAMYNLMIRRVYQGIPEDKRPIGPGSGLSLHLDAGVTDANTAILIRDSFAKRFNNPNASWDIGGYVSSADGIAYTYTKKLVDGMFRHMKTYSVNKPYTGKYTNISADEYISFFPDVDDKDWERRETFYTSGGNAWIMDVNGNLQRKSQRTLYREGDTSDLLQENNMRTLSQLVYLLQNKIDTYLLEYNDDGVLKTLKDDVDNLFTNWVGNLVQALDITFQRDINPLDGGEILVCYCNVTFRGLILRVPIIVNVQRREQ